MKLWKCDHCKTELYSPGQVTEVSFNGKKYDLCPSCLVILDAWLKRKMETVSKDWLDSLQATAPGYDADAKEERIAIQEENKP